MTNETDLSAVKSQLRLEYSNRGIDDFDNFIYSRLVEYLMNNAGLSSDEAVALINQCEASPVQEEAASFADISEGEISTEVVPHVDEPCIAEKRSKPPSPRAPMNPLLKGAVAAAAVVYLASSVIRRLRR